MKVRNSLDTTVLGATQGFMGFHSLQELHHTVMIKLQEDPFLVLAERKEE